jgi:acyl-CoA thioesterase FadM
MSRIKIEITGKLLTTVSVPVRITDINYGNHTGNDALVGLIQEARMIWLRQYNYTELQIEGAGLIMSDLALEFKNESFYGDILEIGLYAGEITKKSFELFYNISAQRKTDTVLIAKAKTGMVCFDYMEKKVVSIPEKLMEVLIG